MDTDTLFSATSNSPPQGSGEAEPIPLPDLPAPPISDPSPEVFDAADSVDDDATPTDPIRPGGVQYRTLNCSYPLPPRFCPMLKTYSSSTNVRAHPATPLAEEGFLNIESCDPWTRNSSLPRNDTSTKCTLDITGQLPPQRIYDTIIRPGSVDLRTYIFGTKNGMVRTAKWVGRLLTISNSLRCDFPKSAPWGRVPVRISPAYAACLALITDEAKLRGYRSVSMAFREVPLNLPPMNVAFARARVLMGRAVSPVRFVHRLAALYVYSRLMLGPEGGTVICRAYPYVNKVIDVSSLSEWVGKIGNPTLEQNYIPWNSCASEHDIVDTTALQVLSLATADSVVVQGGGYDMSIAYWPPIAKAVVLVNMDMRVHVSDVAVLSPEAIYDVAVAWCVRYAELELFREALQVVSTLMWSADGLTVAALAPRISIPLPEFDSIAYILLPLMGDIDADIGLDFASYATNSSGLIVESAVMAMILGFINQYVSWNILDAALVHDLLADPHHEKEAYAFKRRMSSIGGCQALRAFEQALNHCGINGMFGRIWGQMASSTPLSDYKEYIKKMWKVQISSFDVARLLPKIPRDCALHRWVGCSPAPDLHLRTLYLYSEQEDPLGRLVSLGNLRGVQGVLVIENRDDRSTSTYRCDFAQRDHRGWFSDCQLGDFTLPDGSTTHFGFRLTSATSLLLLRDPQADRYHLTWKWSVIAGDDMPAVVPLPNETDDTPGEGRLQRVLPDIFSRRRSDAKKIAKRLGRDPDRVGPTGDGSGPSGGDPPAGSSAGPSRCCSTCAV
ncbi:MAG: hypothetical protein SEGTV1_gp1 [Sanya eysarcoris guttigerus totivirus 1]|nr:MAG: hypothetical protein SEGTV1_gp1 [Sanya eysarcoris guttigerus totivirus 1]